MKKIMVMASAVMILLLLSFVLIHRPTDVGLSESDEESERMQTIETMKTSPNEKVWSEQEITSMFSRVKKADWEYIDSVLISDYASGCVGAVLFRDKGKETSNVAFFSADENYQQCGTYAKIAAEPDFLYLGDGTVTFKLEKNGMSYNYKITISIDDGEVNFKAEDDLMK